MSRKAMVGRLAMLRLSHADVLFRGHETPPPGCVSYRDAALSAASRLPVQRLLPAIGSALAGGPLRSSRGGEALADNDQ